MIPADPYHQISPSLEWHGNGASYPFLNPSNFIEYPTVYDLSKPHLPYIARYPQDPSIRLDFSHQRHHPFRLDLKEYMCYKTWMEKQLNLYVAWDRFARDINLHVSPIVMTSSPRDGIGPEAGRLRLSHWAGPSVTGSAKVSQSFYGGIIIMILTKGKPVPLAWEFIYKLGEVTRVTSTILPNMGRKCVTEA